MHVRRIVDWMGGPFRISLLGGIVALSAALLFYDLGTKSYWIDEYNNVNIAALPDFRSVTQGILDSFQRQPPAYFWMQHIWVQLFGTGEGQARTLNVWLGLASIVLVFMLARQLFGPDVGLVTAYLLAISPMFVLYARMARYYLPTLAFALLSCCLFLVLMDKRRRRGTICLWMIYTATNTLLILSSYVAGSVLLCQVAAVFARREYRPRIAVWLASLGVAAGLTGGWFLYAFDYIARYPGGPADLATGWSSYVIKLIYPFYSFAIGETLFPWEIPAIMAGLTTIAFVLVGIRQLRHQPATLLFIVTGLLASVLFVVLSTIVFVVDVPFLNIPSRAIFAAPFLYVLVALGFHGLSSRGLQLLGLIILTWCAAVGLGNYYRGLEFHNPIYAVPTREIVAQVSSHSRPGDVIVAEPDTGFSFYYQQTGQPVTLWSSDTALSQLQSQQPNRVWLITFGRDSTRSVTNTALQDWLRYNYRLAMEQGYVEQDSTYRRVKEWLLHRPAYQYKLLVQEYQR
jgi:mannosyltransferase